MKNEIAEDPRHDQNLEAVPKKDACQAPRRFLCSLPNMG
jgi:hypothetical protein